MKKTSKRMARQVLTGLVLLLVGLPGLALAGDCRQCHEQQGVEVKLPPTAPLRLQQATGERRIELADLFAFHGHECPGATTGFLALRHGLELLFPGELARPEDVLVISRTSAGGIKDLIDLVMKGDKPAARSWPPVGLGNGPDRFSFVLIRKSTSEMLEIALRPEALPQGFMALKQQQKQGGLTPEGEQRLHDATKQMILEFPTRSAQELFGTPRPRKIMLWGTVAAAEQDRHVWQQRQQAKQQKARQQQAKP